MQTIGVDREGLFLCTDREVDEPAGKRLIRSALSNTVPSTKEINEGEREEGNADTGLIRH